MAFQQCYHFDDVQHNKVNDKTYYVSSKTISHKAAKPPDKTSF